MRDRSKLTYLKEYKKAKEVTDAVENDLDFLDRMEGKFDPFTKALEDGNVEEAEEEPSKRAKRE